MRRKNMAVEEVNDQNFNAETGNGVVLTDFWATWCGPCRMQSPVIDSLSESMPNVKFTKLDVDANPETSEEFNIRAIPTMIIKKDGNLMETVVGYHTKDQLANILAKYTD